VPRTRRCAAIATLALVDLPPPELEGVRHLEIDVGGVAIHVAEAGEGEPVIMQHGWPQHWYAWRELIGPLAARYRVLCPDLRGFGWSAAPAGGYAMQQLADELVALLDELELDRVRYVGHDWGAFVGFLLGFGHPERVSQLFLMSFPPPWPPEGRPDVRRLLRLWYQVVVAAPGNGAIQAPLVKRILNAARAAGEFSPETLQLYAGRFDDPARANASRQLYRTFLLHGLRPLASGHFKQERLTVPTHLLIGAKDPVLPSEEIGGFEPYADDMTAELLPGVGHFPAEEAAGEVLERITAFFERAGAPS